MKKIMTDIQNYGYERGLFSVVCDKPFKERNRILIEAGNEILNDYITREEEEKLLRNETLILKSREFLT